MSDHLATLPLDFPPLVAMAEGMARELYAADDRVYVLRGMPPLPTSIREPLPQEINRCAVLLADLSRPASRDAWARWLAERVGLTVGNTAPVWQYEYPSPSPRDADGAPHREDHPALWALTGLDFEWAYFASDDEDAEWFPERWHNVPGISALTDPSEALRAAILAVGAS